MYRKMILAIAILLGPGTVAQASSTLVVGNHDWLGLNQNGGPQNTIQIYISGNDTNISGIGINIQIGDGGPLAGGSVVGPGITANMLTPGALFATNNTGINDTNPGQIFGDQVVFLGTTTKTGTVSDVGGVLLLTLTVDTTGFTEFKYPLLFSGTVNGDTMIGGPNGIIPLEITNGSIYWEPEPSSLVLALLAAGGFAVWGWRRRATIID